MIPNRYPVAQWAEGPEWKQGYDFFRGYINQNLGMGVVVHSAEGSLLGAIGVLESRKQASWHLTFPKVGAPFQHYSLNAITWHCGRYGDDGSQVAGNGCLIGLECEGKAGEPLTVNQVTHLLRFLEWYWRARGLGEPSRPDKEQTFPERSIPLILNDELWEHKEISATLCPSDRIPWPVLIKGMATAEQPTEWELYTRTLHHTLQYFHRVETLAESLRQKKIELVAVWRRSSADPPLDHEVLKEVSALCQQLMAATTDLYYRCQGADRGK